MPRMQGSREGRLDEVYSCSDVGVIAALVLQGMGSKMHRYGESKLASRCVGVVCAGFQ